MLKNWGMLRKTTYLPQTLHWNWSCGPSLVLVTITELGTVGRFFFAGLAIEIPANSGLIRDFGFDRRLSRGLEKLKKVARFYMLKKQTQMRNTKIAIYIYINYPEPIVMIFTKMAQNIWDKHFRQSYLQLTFHHGREYDHLRLALKRILHDIRDNRTRIQVHVAY